MCVCVCVCVCARVRGRSALADAAAAGVAAWGDGGNPNPNANPNNPNANPNPNPNERVRRRSAPCYSSMSRPMMEGVCPSSSTSRLYFTRTASPTRRRTRSRRSLGCRRGARVRGTAKDAVRPRLLRVPSTYSTRGPGDKPPCASGTYPTREAGTRSPYVPNGGAGAYASAQVAACLPPCTGPPGHHGGALRAYLGRRRQRRDLHRRPPCW